MSAPTGVPPRSATNRDKPPVPQPTSSTTRPASGSAAVDHGAGHGREHRLEDVVVGEPRRSGAVRPQLAHLLVGHDAERTGRRCGPSRRAPSTLDGSESNGPATATSTRCGAGRKRSAPRRSTGTTRAPTTTLTPSRCAASSRSSRPTPPPGAERRRMPPVIVGSAAASRSAPGSTTPALTLADGTVVDLDVTDGHVDVAEPLPIGCHVLALAGPGVDEATTIVTAPPAMPTSPALAGGAAVFVPAYALWERDVAAAVVHPPGRARPRRSPTLGVDTLITLPLYAAFLDEPFDPSPYAPVSRLHWNEVYLDDAALPGGTGAARSAQLIDWRALGRRRRPQLLDAVGQLPGRAGGRRRALGRRRPRRRRLRPVPRQGRRRLDRRRRVPSDVVEAQPPARPVPRPRRARRDCTTPAAAAFALDLPIGSHPLGFETWAHADLFAAGMARRRTARHDVPGRPELGVPAAAARRRRAQRLRPVARRRAARAGEYASLLRIDHVLGVHRLWWIPDGMEPGDGVYVRYPRAKLLAVIAAEAARTGTTVVGEDLGTVPAEITEAMERLDDARAVRRADPPRRRRSSRRSRPAPSPACGPTTWSRSPLLYERGDLAGYRDQAAACPRPTRRHLASGAARGCARPSRRRRTPTSSSPTSTICSARRRRTTSPARSCRRSGGAGCAGRRRRRSPTRRCAGHLRTLTAAEPLDDRGRRPTRRARPPPVQRGHAPPPPRLPRRPPRRHRLLVRRVGAERQGRRRRRRLHRLAAADRPRTGRPTSGVWSGHVHGRRGRPRLPVRRSPRRDGERDGDGPTPSPRRRSSRRRRRRAIADLDLRLGRRRVDRLVGRATITADAPISIYEVHLGSWGRARHAGTPLADATTSSPTRSPTTCSATVSPTSSCSR